LALSLITKIPFIKFCKGDLALFIQTRSQKIKSDRVASFYFFSGHSGIAGLIEHTDRRHHTEGWLHIAFEGAEHSNDLHKLLEGAVHIELQGVHNKQVAEELQVQQLHDQ
jgi:hypothetical protein